MTTSEDETVVDEQELIWEDPAPRGPKAKRVAWEEILAPLEEYPNAWAKIRTFPTVQKSTVAAGSLRKQFGIVNWEFASRTDPNTKEGLLYARFINPDE